MPLNKSCFLSKNLRLIAAWALLIVLLSLLPGCGSNSNSYSNDGMDNQNPNSALHPSWRLTWSDEFDGSVLNDSNWNIQTGDGSQYGIQGWGNNELQWYKTENIDLIDGNLVITAREEQNNGYAYTSGRIRSNTKVDIQYGRIEASIQAPKGQGYWPAFWMLPTNSKYGGWAAGGEIDIFEAINPATTDDSEIHGTIHYGMAWPLNQKSGKSYRLDPTNGFHQYAIEWHEGEIHWFVDGEHYHSVTSDQWWSYFDSGNNKGYISEPDAPFNQPFHLLLNLAVGGLWPGSPDYNTLFPSQMLVDYVRVYSCNEATAENTDCGSSLNPDVSIPEAAEVFTNSYYLYEEGLGSISWQINGEHISQPLQLIGGTEVFLSESEDRVIDLSSTGAGRIALTVDRSSSTDTASFHLFGMGVPSAQWERHAAELSFDLYIDRVNTDQTGSLIIKIESLISDAVSGTAFGSSELYISKLAQNQWIRLSVPFNELLANQEGSLLNFDSITHLFVLETSSFAHIQVDNIELTCAYPEKNGCGISPP